MMVRIGRHGSLEEVIVQSAHVKLDTSYEISITHYVKKQSYEIVTTTSCIPALRLVFWF